MRFLGPVSLLLFSTLAWTGLSVAAGPDPIEALREALYIRLQDTRNPPLAVLEHRRKVLEERIAALKTMRDLRRALTLSEWKEDIGEDTIRAVDEEIRRKIAERFIQAVRNVIITGDTTSKLAVANMIAEMGPTVRAINREDMRGFAQGLTNEIITLSKDASLAVRLEALRALGTINADPVKAVPVLREALAKGDAQEKRVAAYALGQMVRVVNHLLKRGQAKTGIEATRDDFVKVAAAVVAASSAGYGDADPQVRQLSFDAVDTAAHALGDFILEPFPRTDFPPPGRLLTKEDLEFMLAREELVKLDLAQFALLLNALKLQNMGLVQGLSDQVPAVRLIAITALENIAYARGRIIRWIDSIPDPQATRENGDYAPTHWAAKVYVDPLEPLLKKSLNAPIVLLYDPDVRVRRVAIDFLERIGEAAAPAADALADRLCDEDRFVRWAAARTLGYLAPEVVAVPKRLSLAVRGLGNLLADNDLDVRLAAAETLKLLGPAAIGAIPALNQAIVEGDPEARMGAMQALASIGLKGAPGDVAECTIRNLCLSLDARTGVDARVRRSAAETLGIVVPQLPATLTSARQLALSSLREALGDDDNEVRINAGDAILSIQNVLR